MRVTVLMLAVVASLCAGCSTSHGVRATGPISYFVGKNIADEHVKMATRKGPLLEAKLESDGTLKAGFNLLNVDGWTAMTLWEKVKYSGSVAAECVAYGYAGNAAYKAYKDSREDESEKTPDIVYANDRDTLSIQNGSGTVHMDYEIMAGSPKPDNIYVSNAGGTVDLDVREVPAE